MNFKFDIKNTDIVQQHIYGLRYKKKNYDVMAIYSNAEDEDKVHAQFYLVEGKKLTFLFEHDRIGDLTDEDSCIDVGLEMLYNNFEAFMKTFDTEGGKNNEKYQWYCL